MAAITTFKRAKIFQPFDALPGLREALAQKEWEHAYTHNTINIKHVKRPSGRKTEKTASPISF